MQGLFELKPLELPMRDEILFHPDDFKNVPPLFIGFMAERGIQVKSFLWLQKGKILVTGKLAMEIRKIKFHEDVERAMAENSAFLKIMQQNGLA